MRIRSANSKAIQNTIGFLNDVKHAIETKEFKRDSIKTLQRDWQISNSTGSAMRELGIVKRSNRKIEWLGSEPSRQMALLVLDLLLHKSKRKARETPLSSDFITQVDKIVEKLSHISNQNETWLKTAKTPLLSKALNQSPMNDNNLFSNSDRREQRRFELLSSIASGVYSKVDLCNHEWVYTTLNDFVGTSSHKSKTVCNKCGKEPDVYGDIFNFQTINNTIIMATEDLLEKYYKK